MSASDPSVFLLANGRVETPSAAVAIAVIIVLGAIVAIPLIRFKPDELVKLWASFGAAFTAIVGVGLGSFGAYFFTRHEVQQQQSQTKMYQSAYLASEREKVEAGEQFLKLAKQIKPDVASPQGQQLLETFTGLAWGLTKEKVPVDKTHWYSRKMTTPPDTSHDLFLRKTPSPSPP